MKLLGGKFKLYLDQARTGPGCSVIQHGVTLDVNSRMDRGDFEHNVIMMLSMLW